MSITYQKYIAKIMIANRRQLDKPKLLPPGLNIIHDKYKSVAEIHADFIENNKSVRDATHHLFVKDKVTLKSEKFEGCRATLMFKNKPNDVSHSSKLFERDDNNSYICEFILPDRPCPNISTGSPNKIGYFSVSNESGEVICKSDCFWMKVAPRNTKNYRKLKREQLEASCEYAYNVIENLSKKVKHTDNKPRVTDTVILEMNNTDTHCNPIVVENDNESTIEINTESNINNNLRNQEKDRYPIINVIDDEYKSNIIFNANFTKKKIQNIKMVDATWYLYEGENVTVQSPKFSNCTMKLLFKNKPTDIIQSEKSFHEIVDGDFACEFILPKLPCKNVVNGYIKKIGYFHIYNNTGKLICESDCFWIKSGSRQKRQYYEDKRNIKFGIQSETANVTYINSKGDEIDGAIFPFRDAQVPSNPFTVPPPNIDQLKLPPLHRPTSPVDDSRIADQRDIQIEELNQTIDLYRKKCEDLKLIVESQSNMLSSYQKKYDDLANSIYNK